MSEKVSHTPGPWYVERKYEGSCTVAIMRDWSKSDVALAVHGPQNWIHVEGAGPDTIEANARLIAAAPDLLEAVRAGGRYSDALLRYQANGVSGQMVPGTDELERLFMDWHEKGHAAIAKAEGRETAVTR